MVVVIVVIPTSFCLSILFLTALWRETTPPPFFPPSQRRFSSFWLFHLAEDKCFHFTGASRPRDSTRTFVFATAGPRRPWQRAVSLQSLLELMQCRLERVQQFSFGPFLRRLFLDPGPRQLTLFLRAFWDHFPRCAIVEAITEALHSVPALAIGKFNEQDSRVELMVPKYHYGCYGTQLSELYCENLAGTGFD